MTVPGTAAAFAASRTSGATGQPMSTCLVGDGGPASPRGSRCPARTAAPGRGGGGDGDSPCVSALPADRVREEFLELLELLVYRARSHVPSLSAMEEFHLSLSQCVVLRYHWIQPFVSGLRARLAAFHRYEPCRAAPSSPGLWVQRHP